MRNSVVAVMLAVCAGFCAAQADPNQATVPASTPRQLPAQGDVARSTPGAATTRTCRTSDLKLLDGADPARNGVLFGGSFHIRVSGDCLALMREQRQRVDLTKVVTVYLDGVAVKGLPIFLSEDATGNGRLSITLVRDSENVDNRASWHGILSKRQTDLPMHLPVSLSVGSDLPVDLPDGTQLLVNTVRGGGTAVVLALLVGVSMLIGAFELLRRNNALRDTPGGAYSLGKSQMAFWGLLVLLCFLGVWVLTGGMERIPQQTLVLLGISGGTGLAAVLIGQTKANPAARLANLKAEKALLDARHATATATPDDPARLATIEPEIRALEASAQRSHTSWGDFFHDICHDGTGITFPRIQVVVWTLMLGCIFVWTVSQVISMPEFPETLLLLLGISNGTYLGFKFPEKS